MHAAGPLPLSPAREGMFRQPLYGVPQPASPLPPPPALVSDRQLAFRRSSPPVSPQQLRSGPSVMSPPMVGPPYHPDYPDLSTHYLVAPAPAVQSMPPVSAVQPMPTLMAAPTMPPPPHRAQCSTTMVPPPPQLVLPPHSPLHQQSRLVYEQAAFAEQQRHPSEVRMMQLAEQEASQMRRHQEEQHHQQQVTRLAPSPQLATLENRLLLHGSYKSTSSCRFLRADTVVK